MELGSKRGSEQEREEDPKRPRVDGMVQIPTQLMDAMIPYMVFPDELWQQLLVRLPQESVDALLPQLHPNHFLRRHAEQDKRLEVAAFFNNLAPTKVALSQDRNTLTLTLSDNFRSIFKKPLDNEIKLQRSDKFIILEDGGDLYDDIVEVSGNDIRAEHPMKLPYFYTQIDPTLSDAWDRLTSYASTYSQPPYKHSRSTLQFAFAASFAMLYVVIPKTKSEPIESESESEPESESESDSSESTGNDNNLMVYFVEYKDPTFHNQKGQQALPFLSTMSKNYADLVAKRLGTPEGRYGIADLSNFRLTVQAPLEYYHSPNAPFTGQWIVKLNGFGSIFDPPLSQIEVQWVQTFHDEARFRAQNLPPNLKMNQRNYDSVARLLQNNYISGPGYHLPLYGYDMPQFSIRNFNDRRQGRLQVTFNRREDEIYIDFIATATRRIDTVPDLKALWHYTQPPRQGRTVNMAAVRRKDLLGLH